VSNKQLYLLCAVILFTVSNIFRPALLFGIALSFLALFFIHRNMNEPLSPAAQAVDDATRNTWFTRDFPRPIAAAALRAASGRTGDLIGDISHPKFAEGVLAAVDLLERIANELETPNA
jgi:hypothetical protein